MDKAMYRSTIRKMKRDGRTGACCIICGEGDPRAIESHHIYGRIIPNDKVSLCINCHRKITDEQNKLPPDKRSGVPFAALSAAAFFKVLAEMLIEAVHDEVDNE